MALPFNEFQDDLFGRLEGNITDLSSTAVSVRDHIDENTARPYVELDGFTAAIDEDNDGRTVDVTYTFNAYSDYRGSKEINSILSQLGGLLVQPFQPTGNVGMVGPGFIQNVSVERETSPEESVTRRGTLSVMFRLRER